MKNITLSEAEKAHQKLKKEITKSVDDFINHTGLTIESIIIHLEKTPIKQFVVGVDVTIKLP